MVMVVRMCFLKLKIKFTNIFLGFDNEYKAILEIELKNNSTIFLLNTFYFKNYILKIKNRNS